MLLHVPHSECIKLRVIEKSGKDTSLLTLWTVWLKKLVKVKLMNERKMLFIVELWSKVKGFAIGSLRHSLFMLICGSGFYRCVLCEGEKPVLMSAQWWCCTETVSETEVDGGACGCHGWVCLSRAVALVLSVCIHSFAESGGTEGGAVAWARAVAGYKPLMSVFHYQMLWWHVVWQGYKTQVSTKCQTMQNFGSGDISKESHVSIA